MPSHSRCRRRSIRLPGYDYSSPGAYSVTIVTRGREHLFGQVVAGEMRLNAFGEIVAETWLWLARQYPYVRLDEWVVMPNHFHGILWIVDISNDAGRGASRRAPTGGSQLVPTDENPIKIKPLGQLVGAFKTVSAKRINLLRGTPGVSVWQRDYYERIVRDDRALDAIRRYIRYNPLRWDEDRENK